MTSLTTMTEPDASLVARARLGDTSAFDALLRRHFRAALLIAFGQTGSREDAEDVCQDAFVRAWERLADCRDPERVAAWLMRIVRNTAHNRREYMAVRATTPLVQDSPFASPHRSDERTERAELRAQLGRALARLGETQREVVLLHDLEGWPHAEIARQLDISELMSRRHLSDSRKRLREFLGDYATLHPDHD